MNINRTAVIGGTAALLLVLTGCAGVEGQFDDGARAESAQNRAAAAQSRLSSDQVAQAIEVHERLREVKQSESRGQAAQRTPVDLSRAERIREVKQSESTPVTSVRERIREAKQSESEPVVSADERIRQAKQHDAQQVQ